MTAVSAGEPGAAHGDAGSPATGRPATYRDALRSGEFRGLVAAQVASEWGDHIARIALASLVLARTDSAFLTVLAFVVSFLPAVLGAAVLGGLADRLPRKVVLLACDLGRAAVIAVLALLAVDSTPIWVLLGVLFAAELFSAPFDAAQRSVVPDVLGQGPVVLAGMGLMRVLYQVNQVVGLLLGGVVVHAVGARQALLLDSATFLISFLVVLLTLRGRPAAMEAGEEHTSLLHDLRAGWGLVFGEPSLRALVALGWGAALFVNAPEAVALAYARDDGAGAQAGGALMACLPAGAAAGAYLLGRVRPMRQIELLLPLAVLTCLPLLATAVDPPWQAALVLWLLSGMGQGFLLPLIGTVNLLTPASHRGRVNGLAGAGFNLASAVSLLLVGGLADLSSPAVSVTVAGVLGMALVGAVHRTWPRAEIRRAGARVYPAG